MVHCEAVVYINARDTLWNIHYTDYMNIIPRHLLTTGIMRKMIYITTIL